MANRMALLLVLGWAGLVGTLAVLKHLSFNSSAYDLGVFDQVVWNSSHGRLFENSVAPEAPHFLGLHFAPIVVILVPLYWVYPSPITLVCMQALLLAVAGVPIYLLARDLLHSHVLALTMLVAYLLQPATAYIALFDFHEVAIAMPLLATALYFLLRQRYAPFGLALGLAFLAKEDIGLIGAAIGMFIVFSQRRWRLGLGVVLAGTLWTFLLVCYIIPSLNPSGVYQFAALYKDLGTTPQGLVSNILHDPSRFLRPMVGFEKQAYIQQLLAPLGGLSLLGWPVLVIATPSFLSVLLSDSFPRLLIRHHYSAMLLPTLLAASVVGLAWVRSRTGNCWHSLVPGVVGFVVAAAVLGGYLYGPLPLARNFEPQQYQQAPRLATARELIAQIPDQASVIAQSGLVPQLCHRRTIEVFSRAEPGLLPDYYFLDTDSNALRYPLPQGYDYPYLKALSKVKADAGYRLIADRDGYLLFHRETPDVGQTIGVTFGDQITLVGYHPDNLEVAPSGSLKFTLYWRAERQPEVNYSLFAHLIATNGKRWGQQDGSPTGEYLPTSEWEPGRLWRADWSIPVDAEAPPGEYQVLVGLYDSATMQRLPITGGGLEPRGDSLTLDTARVTATPRTDPHIRSGL